MPRRKIVLLYGIAGVVLTCGVTALVAALHHEPNFYRQAQIPPGAGRHKQALECGSRFIDMDSARKDKRPTWGLDASEVGLNSLFQEFFQEDNAAPGNLGITSPAIVLEGENQLRLAFRYDTGWFSTVMSYHLKVWLVPKEPNTIAVEVMSARAGALPMSSQTILQQLCELVRQKDKKVTLYRNDGNTVAIIQRDPNENHPWWAFTALQVEPNKFTIRGKTLNHALPPPKIN